MAAMVTGVVIGAFVVGAVLWSIAARGQTLDRVPLLDGERVLVEVDRVHAVFEVPRRKTHEHYPGCVVRVTNLRLVIAQRGLFSRKSPWLRAVVRYGAAPDGFDSERAVPRSYYARAFGLFRAERFEKAEHHGRPELRIAVRADAGAEWMVETVVLRGDRLGELEPLLLAPAA